MICAVSNTISLPFAALYKLYHRQGTSEQLRILRNKVPPAVEAVFGLSMTLELARGVNISGGYFENITSLPVNEWPISTWVFNGWIGACVGLTIWAVKIKLPESVRLSELPLSARRAGG